jgi:hypothetical protein
MGFAPVIALVYCLLARLSRRSARRTVSSAICVSRARRLISAPQLKQASSFAGATAGGTGWKSSQPQVSQRPPMLPTRMRMDSDYRTRALFQFFVGSDSSEPIAQIFCLDATLCQTFRE